MIPPEKWYELVECPNCGSDEEATVTFPQGHPWPTYIHTCSKCGHIIMESEWNERKQGK